MGFMKYIRTQWDRTGAVTAALLGLLALQLGWLGVSGTEYLAKQMPYVVSGGLLGIFLLGLGSTLWISADLRDEWRQLRELNSTLRAMQPSPNGRVVGENVVGDRTGPEAESERVGADDQ